MNHHLTPENDPLDLEESPDAEVFPKPSPEARVFPPPEKGLEAEMLRQLNTLDAQTNRVFEAPSVDRRRETETERPPTLAEMQLGQSKLPERQWGRQAAMLLACFMMAFYLSYRLWFTLNLTSMYASIISVTLYIAEFYGAMLLAVFFFQIWKLIEPPVKKPLQGKTIDVFVPTYNEDIQLLQGTLRACRQLDYPHRTYVLDDGNRPEVRQLADRLGIEYINRADNQHAKAGNINNGLAQTGGEFVVILDADHVPVRHMLHRLIGYFEDPELAFVQAPHTTYNLDNFLGRWNADSRLYWEDVRLFFDVVQLGKNHWNSSNFCGSAAMFRREALEEVGGFATETITEDLHTGMRLHSKGWKSLAVGEQLVAGLSPEDIATFNTQRLRWGEGNLSVAAFDNPLTMRGLTFPQRICYLGSLLNWTYGPARLAMYLTPILMLITDIAPVRGTATFYFVLLAVYLLSVWSAVKIASRGCGQIFAIEISMMSGFFVQLRSCYRALFRRRHQKFVVTDKKKKKTKKTRFTRHILPQAIIGSLSLAAVTWACVKLILGLSHDFLGIAIGTPLCLYHAYLAYIVVRRSKPNTNRRQQWRHPANLYVEAAIRKCPQPPAGGPLPSTIRGVTLDFHEGGLSMLASRELPEGTVIDIELVSPIKSVQCRGKVRGVRAAREKGRRQGVGYLHHIQLFDVTDAEVDGFATIAMQYVVPGMVDQYRVKRKYRHQLKRWWFERSVMKRIRRLDLPLAARFFSNETPEREQKTVLQRVGKYGMQAVLTHPIPKGSEVDVLLETFEGEFSGTYQVADVEAVRVGPRVVHQHRFNGKPLGASKQKELERFLKMAQRNQWSRVFRYINHQRFFFNDRAIRNQLSFCCLGVIFFTATLFVYLHRSDLLMLSILRGRDVTPVVERKFENIGESAVASPVVTTAHLLRVHDTAYRLKKYELAAMAALRLADRIPEERREWLINAARDFYRVGDYHAADKWFREIRAMQSTEELPPEKQADLLVDAGRAANSVSDPARAIALFRKAAEVNPSDTALIQELFGLLVKMRRIEEALALLDRIYLEEEESPEGRLRMQANLHDIGDNLEQASILYRKLLDNHPDDRKILKRLGDIAARQEDFIAALPYYRHLSELSPENETWRNRLREVLVLAARQHREKHEYDRAKKQFAEALEMEKKPDEAIHLEFAQLLVQMGELQEAKEQLQYLENFESLDLLASVLEMQQDFQAAAKVYDQMLELRPPTPELLRRAALAERMVGRFSKAIELLRRLETQNEATFEDQQTLIDMLLAEKEYRQAIPRIERLRQILPNSPRLRSNFLAAVAALTKPANALVQKVLKDYQAGKEFQFSNFSEDDLKRLGDILQKAGKLSEAQFVFQQGVERFPESRYLRLHLAEILSQQGHPGKAEEHFEQLLQNLSLSQNAGEDEN